MSDVETVDIDKRYGTVRALLEATVKPEHLLGEGSTAFGYKFPSQLGLDNAVLRIHIKPHPITVIKETTALTPVGSLLTGTNLGQPLIESESDRIDKPIRIVLKQDGPSLYDSSLTVDNTGRYETKSVSRIQLLESILNLHKASGANPFTPLLLKSLQVLLSDHYPDLNWSNVFINGRTHSLELIDQLDPNRKFDHNDLPLLKSDIYKIYGQIVSRMLRSDPAHIEDVHERAALIHKLDRMSPNELNAFDTAYAKVIALLREALAEIITRYVDDKEPVPPLQFVPHQPFNAVNSTHAIALTDPPSKLVAELKRLHAIVNAPAR